MEIRLNMFQVWSEKEHDGECGYCDARINELLFSILEEYKMMED